ncbi:MAG: hypothetical protein B7Z02_15265 [Rhodobacterales bacterium 32-67-9]|nr:MAG: hypothetical protein B7Z02_15265 [Rhodobacterales bacterium 32-67-9]
MAGEMLALFAALSYGGAGVTIMQGRATARDDNGVALSVAMTAALSFALWSLWGNVPARAIFDAPATIGLFALAGVFSIFLGRVTMYRATESIGAVRAALLRRLTPVFALPLAMIALSERPGAQTIFGGAMIVAGILIYSPKQAGDRAEAAVAGTALGIASAAFYAAAYTLRAMGMRSLPDAAFGTLVGAIAGGAALALAAGLRGQITGRRPDLGPWHWVTAAFLSAGQVLQFFALKSATVTAVACLGTLEVFISAALLACIGDNRRGSFNRLALSGLAAFAGTLLLFSGRV